MENLLMFLNTQQQKNYNKHSLKFLGVQNLNMFNKYSFTNYKFTKPHVYYTTLLYYFSNFIFSTSHFIRLLLNILLHIFEK